MTLNTFKYLSCATLLFICSQSSASELPIQDYEKQILLSIHGSNTVGASLMPAWAQDYLETLGATNISFNETGKTNEYNITGQLNDKTYSIHIAAHGSSTGFKAVHAGKADIAMASRAIKKKEAKLLAHLGDMHSFNAENIIAMDGLAIIVHPTNPINSLSINKIAKIFSGEITNWSEVGGKDKAITTYARDENSGTWDTFNSLILKKNKALLIPTAQRFESNNKLSDLISNDPSGIGFAGLASVRNAKAVSVSDGYTAALLPETLFVATEDYPLSRRLYVYKPPKVINPRASDFIEFIQTSQSQKRVTDIGFVSLSPIAKKPDGLADTPASYASLIENGERLSINFRFQSGSASLDNRAQRDIQRILEYLHKPENENKEIQLIGFGDLKQTKKRAVLLSKLRASAVQAALYKKGVHTLPVVGFGAFMPVASHEEKNRVKNQRVEIWLLESGSSHKKDHLKKGAHMGHLSDVVYFSN